MLNRWFDSHTLDGYDQSQSDRQKKPLHQGLWGLSGASLTITLLLALTPSPDAQALIISNVDPIAIAPLQNYTKSNVFTYTPQSSSQTSSNRTITSAPINLTGSLTDTDAGVSYTIGTSRNSNPAFGLDFFARGSATFDYLWPLTVKHDAPEHVVAGQNFTINPYVDLTVTDPSMSVTQNINWGAEFYSSYNDVYDFSINLPNISVPTVGNLNLSGNDTMNSTTSSFNADSSAGGGVGTVTTDSSEVDAWSVSADLLSVVSKFLTLDPVSSVAVAAADALFDLDATLGVDIHRIDKLTLWGFDFSDSTGDLSSPVTISTPDNVESGDLFEYTFDSRLNYNASITSLYYYGGQASLSLDPLFLDPWEIGSGDFGNQLVGTSQLFWDDLETTVSLFGQTSIDDGSCNSDGEFCVFTSDIRNYLSQPDVINSLPTVSPGNTTFIDYKPTNIPEPATWSLMVLGLLGFIRRKKDSPRVQYTPPVTT